MDVLNGMFGKVAPGMCRLSWNGDVAVKTSGGYKSFDVKKQRLINCDNFVFNVGEEFFFVIPTKKVEIGDIILVGGKPKCVIEGGDHKIIVLNYEDSTIETLIPEHHVFMGNTYFYGKIVSMFGKLGGAEKKGGNKILKYMMMKELMKGTSAGSEGMMNHMLPLMMMGGGSMTNMFDDMFSFDDENEED